MAPTLRARSAGQLLAVGAFDGRVHAGGCTVAPGCEFADFQMLEGVPGLAAELAQRHPEAARL